jgi:hypothetical protein
VRGRKDELDLAYHAYLAAADREEAAALHYRRNVEADTARRSLSPVHAAR